MYTYYVQILASILADRSCTPKIEVCEGWKIDSYDLDNRNWGLLPIPQSVAKV